MQPVNKAKDLLSDARAFWKKAPTGKYVNYRSIFAYSVGGIGVYAIIFMVNTITVTASNVIISNATGIPPRQLLYMYYLTFFAGIFFTGFRAKMIDNLRSKKGKYRPYILSMGVPTAVICCLIVFVPYERITTYAIKWIIALVLNCLLQFVYGFFYEAYENLIFVMSPNTQERSDVTSIKSIVYSFAPTVLNPLIPLLVRFLNASDMYDVRIYKILFPPTAIVGILLTALVYVYTEENIVQAKTHVVQIRFLDALRAVAKNKYFWIISCAGWLGFLESTQGYILGWLYTYAGMCSDVEYSLITIIYGNASLWGMLAAPFAIKKFGKKNVLIFTNLMNIIFIVGMYPSIHVFESIWLVLVCLYMNAVVSSFSHILTPSINADIRDYQHFITGERIDGMFAAVGLIGSFISLLTGTVTPMIFEKYGINENNGYEHAFDILKYEPDTLYSLVYLLIFLSVIGAAMNVVPYFFYDLSELKQRGMIRILKIRALFEDYGNNALNDSELVEAVDLVREARENAIKQKKTLTKTAIKTAQTHEAKKAAKKQYFADKHYNEEIDIANMVINELNKFSSRAVLAQLANAKVVYAGGIEGVRSIPADVLSKAKALPKTTAEEKLIRTNEIELAKTLRRGKKYAERYFPNGIKEYNMSVITDIFARDDEIDEQLDLLYKERYVAKDGKNNVELGKLAAEIKVLKQEEKQLEKKLNHEMKASSMYNRTEKAYLDAKKLIAQEKNYDHFEDISALYDDAKVRSEEKARLEKEESDRLEAIRRAEKAAIKAEKAAKRKK